MLAGFGCCMLGLFGSMCIRERMDAVCASKIEAPTDDVGMNGL